MRALAIAMLHLLLAAAAAHGSDATVPPLDPAADRVLARMVVPDTVRRQGEVRLVARGDATVVETLLSTKVLERVVAEIRKKETRNWPDGAPGHADRTRYLDALGGAAGALEARAETAEDDGRRLRLFIDFVATASGGGIVIGEFEGDEVDGALRPTRAQPMATVAVERSYLLRNMRLILADAFHVDESAVGTIGPLGPLADRAAPP